MTALLRTEKLSIEFKTRTSLVEAVKDVSFALHKGETYGLVGESGCGKSTMAFAIMGYVADNGRVAQGKVLYKDLDLVRISRSNLRRLWGREITMVYQDPSSHLNPSMRIGEQMAEAVGNFKRIRLSKVWDRIVALLESVRFTDPKRIARSYPHQLSGGMRQRVCIAMALAKTPDLLIMDEPTTALDVTNEAVVLDLINDLKKQHDVAILYITHDLGVVARISDRVGVMYLGRLVEEASVGELFRNPCHPYTQGLLGCIPKLGETKHSSRLQPIPGAVGRPQNTSAGCLFAERCTLAQPECRPAEPDLQEVAPGHLLACVNPEIGSHAIRESKPFSTTLSLQDAQSSATLLKARRVKYYYRVREGFLQGLWGKAHDVKAVDDVSFQLNRCRTLSVVGESGCGKSTLARLVVGLLAPDEGELLLGGKDIAKPVRKRSKNTISRISIVFQDPDSTLNPKHTIGFTLTNVLKQRKGSKSLSGNLKDEGLRYLQMVNLGRQFYGRYPRELSGGEKQRVAVARALALKPDLIVCDEPTSALDVSVQAAILTLLLELQRKLELSYLLISHDLSVVHYLSDYIAVMYLGQICEAGSTTEIFWPPYHPYTEALLSAIPIADPGIEQKGIRLHGRLPSLITTPNGCRFHSRCPRKIGAICEQREPPGLKSATGHTIYCHIPWQELETVSPVIAHRGQK
jgi:peptide/nickel transport system ATP-binding protein